MIIPPPDNYGMTIELMIGEDELAPFTQEQYEIIKQRLLIKPWICPNCHLTNFGLNKKCADWRCRCPKNSNQS